MHVAGKSLPCGCQARKEIMFEQGNPDTPLAIIAGFTGLMLATAIYLKVRS